MPHEFRTPEERDRSTIVDLSRIAFNVPAGAMRLLGAELRLERFLCAYQGERMVAMSLAYPLDQWFGGRAVPMAGIGGVSTAPERRDAGLAPELLRALLLRSKQAGALISTLYPSRTLVYRRLGYEFAGQLTQYRVPIAELPAGSPACVIDELGNVNGTDGAPGADGADMDGLRACYRRVAAHHNGYCDSADEDWWRVRVVRRWNPDVNSRAAVARGADGSIEGYVTFTLEPIPDSWHFRIACTHLVAATPQAMASLVQYVRGFRGLGSVLQWWGSANDPIGLMAAGGAESVTVSRSVRWMTRLLDVKGALEARGYGPVTGEIAIEVDDPMFEDNAGRYLVRASEGRVAVERAPASLPPGKAVKLSIGALSSLYTGYATPWELGRAGMMSAGEAPASFLARLFEGPRPISTDFF